MLIVIFWVHYVLGSFSYAQRVILCVYSIFSSGEHTGYYKWMKGKPKLEVSFIILKALLLFSVLYVRLDVVKYHQGSNQVFKVKGNSLHYR